MVRTFIQWLVVALLLSTALVYIALGEAPIDARTGSNQWVMVYQQFIRASFFTAFITLGSFLLTLKTAIIQRLKEAYDSADYKEKYLRYKQLDPNVSYYGGLERLGIALATNVILALGTSILQMTVGFISNALAVSVCVGFAATTVGLVFYLTVQIFLAHQAWFKKIEEVKKAEIAKESQQPSQ